MPEGNGVSQQDHGELERAARRLKKAMWEGEDVQRLLHEIGIQVVPANFYSIVPTPDDFDNSFEYTGSAPYLDPEVFDAQAMTSYLEDVLMPFSAEFDPPSEDPKNASQSYFWKNPAFSFSDAMAYYCVIRERKPKTIIEVGSGYSTLVAKTALQHNGTGELIAVEPYPMEWLRNMDGVELHEVAVQELDSGWFNQRLEPGDVLFIDSTHVVKTGSDCAHLYLRVLPHLRGQLMIHTHDIYLPFSMPRDRAQRQRTYWNEAYVLMALLLENPRMKVVYGSAYHYHLNNELLTRFMHDRHPPGGASIWMERR